ncbi:hypothetical protein V3468_06540 [Flavobacterium oreochromis]|uniref:hypothetical protein n=1 Tax=Flavobacterium oreochromis TaxID=2906078 RepID=UPI00385BA357
MENFELIHNKYTPSMKIDWEKTDMDTSKGQTLFIAKLYNSNRIEKECFLLLYLLADEKNKRFVLMVRGKLNDWYFQKKVKRSLTFLEYKDCIKLLSLELDIKQDILMKSKNIRTNVVLNYNLKSRNMNKITTL